MNEFNTKDGLSEEEHELTLQMKNKTLENVYACSQSTRSRDTATSNQTQKKSDVQTGLIKSANFKLQIEQQLISNQYRHSQVPGYQSFSSVEYRDISPEMVNDTTLVILVTVTKQN